MPKGVYERKPGWSSWNKGRTDLGGPKDPRWKRVEKTCVICGAGFFVKRTHAKLRKTCSHKCGARYRSEHYAGENSAHWKGGLSKRAKYKNTFKDEVREKVRERDKVCVCCGSSSELQVHHKNYIRTESHVENLVLVCASCHVTIEKIHASILRRGSSVWKRMLELIWVGVL